MKNEIEQFVSRHHLPTIMPAPAGLITAESAAGIRVDTNKAVFSASPLRCQHDTARMCCGGRRLLHGAVAAERFRGRNGQKRLATSSLFIKYEARNLLRHRIIICELRSTYFPV